MSTELEREISQELVEQKIRRIKQTLLDGQDATEVFSVEQMEFLLRRIFGHMDIVPWDKIKMSCEKEAGNRIRVKAASKTGQPLGKLSLPFKSLEVSSGEISLRADANGQIQWDLQGINEKPTNELVKGAVKLAAKAFNIDGQMQVGQRNLLGMNAGSFFTIDANSSMTARFTPHPTRR